MSYRNLEIWQLTRDVSVSIAKMTKRELPKHEMYECGSQIRRSSLSIRSNIVEGYGRRRYKADYIRFLTYALSSCDEATDQLDYLWETESLRREDVYRPIRDRIETLGRKLNRFLQSVERGHRT